MKKVLVILSFVAITFCLYAEPKLLSSEKSEVRTVQLNHDLRPGKGIISYEELSDDTDHFLYLLINFYAGYDDMKEKGFEPEEFKKIVLNKFCGKNEIQTKEFQDFLLNIS